MTSTGQALQSMSVLLAEVHRDLRSLVVAAPTAPAPSVSSVAYDTYVGRLDAIERRLKRMHTTFMHLRKQGPVYEGRHGDRYRAKQRAASLQAHVDTVDELLAACFVLFGQLLSPQKSLAIQHAVDLGEQLKAFANLLHSESLAVPDGPEIVAPPQDLVGGSPSLSGMLSLLLFAIAVLKKRRRPLGSDAHAS